MTAAATAGLEEIRRRNEVKAKGSKGKGDDKRNKEYFTRLRAEDLTGKQALLHKLLIASQPVLATHCPQNSGVSYRCEYKEGARTPMVELERACANIYGRLGNTEEKDKEWRLTSSNVEDTIDVAGSELGDSKKQYTLVRQMNWWGCNSCGQDVDEAYPTSVGGTCCELYRMTAHIPKSKRTTRRCRAVPHFVKNLVLVEISAASLETICTMTIPPVDHVTGRTKGVDGSVSRSPLSLEGSVLVEGGGRLLERSVPLEEGGTKRSLAEDEEEEPAAKRSREDEPAGDDIMGGTV